MSVCLCPGRSMVLRALCPGWALLPDLRSRGMSWPSSLPHTASLGYYLPRSDSHRLGERVGRCIEALESRTGPDLPLPNRAAIFREPFPPHPRPHPTPFSLYQSLLHAPSFRLSLQDGAFPSANRLWSCLSLREQRAFLSPFSSSLQASTLEEVDLAMPP